MKAIIGLGNPGREYEKTRHNIGFMVLDEIVSQWGDGKYTSKFQGAFAEARLGSDKVLLLKPQTYMNLSGQAVGALVNFYKIDLQDLLVIYDDLDLDLGRLRLRSRGSSGGHNGIKSIISQLGSDSFPRLKMGIGRPPAGRSAASYVLESFATADADSLEKMIDEACKATALWVAEGTTAAMNQFNGKS
ncbi:aminoacyl-tRNA hydrolase [Heliorestis acidaminivorans]|uniref:Peptidyl-tRNA hydrolase n=1 Tax=Heliorestis acidaminivorans TaxID=553427 RepID=A0A6I0EZW5_9FIRM|nr:aminoacyl-tRNA hydrolase [Heliorestis acidaminivorans]KAB2953035.1 aminoacyl-tRNA hydrolase [Heliorestis acidaminivorans]